MFSDIVPGQVIHIRMEGTSATVFFENAPGPFVISDLADVLNAFNDSDWHFFKSRWWSCHAYLKTHSAVLERLASAIDPHKFFSASTLLETAQAAGFYDNQEAHILEWDRERLSILVQVHHQFKQVKAILVGEGATQRLAWPGEVWSRVLLERHSKLFEHHPTDVVSA